MSPKAPSVENKVIEGKWYSNQQIYDLTKEMCQGDPTREWAQDTYISLLPTK